MAQVVTSGDLSGLSLPDKLTYYKARCEAAKLDPRTVPFKIIRDGKREILYADGGATAQLALRNGIGVTILKQWTEGADGKMPMRYVLVRGTDGRRATDELAVLPLFRSTFYENPDGDDTHEVWKSVDGRRQKVAVPGEWRTVKLVGEALANALMKCVTKAYRRCILKMVGLGMPDETEIDTIGYEPPAFSLEDQEAQRMLAGAG
jgi:hypothetical protein